MHKAAILNSFTPITYICGNEKIRYENMNSLLSYPIANGLTQTQDRDDGVDIGIMIKEYIFMNITDLIFSTAAAFCDDLRSQFIFTQDIPMEDHIELNFYISFFEEKYDDLEKLTHFTVSNIMKYYFNPLIQKIARFYLRNPEIGQDFYMQFIDESFTGFDKYGGNKMYNAFIFTLREILGPHITKLDYLIKNVYFNAKMIKDIEQEMYDSKNKHKIKIKNFDQEEPEIQTFLKEEIEHGKWSYNAGADEEDSRISSEEG